jgi:16S rRNA (uracil1498-N3)-methyltransferase
MELARFYCSRIDQPVAELVGGQAHHLASALRLRAGDEVELFDGDGTVATAIIEKAASRKVTLQVRQVRTAARRMQGRIAIAPSIAKGERFDWLVGKCTELGVDRIMPVLFERTVKQPKKVNIFERWKNVAISASKQCGRAFLPEIDKPTRLAEALDVLNSDYPEGRFLVGSLSPPAQRLASQRFDGSDVTAFVGPEGGLTEQEEDLLRERGTESVALTDTVLRVETAGVAFVAILAAQRTAAQMK